MVQCQPRTTQFCVLLLSSMSISRTQAWALGACAVLIMRPIESAAPERPCGSRQADLKILYCWYNSIAQRIEHKTFLITQKHNGNVGKYIIQSYISGIHTVSLDITILHAMVLAKRRGLFSPASLHFKPRRRNLGVIAVRRGRHALERMHAHPRAQTQRHECGPLPPLLLVRHRGSQRVRATFI